MLKTEDTGKKGKIAIFIVALFGALLLWMYAIGYDTEIDQRMFSGIRVELTGLNVNGYTVADSERFSLNIDVNASGTRATLNNASASDFHAYVDISSVKGPGYQTLPVKVVAPNGLTVSEGGISVQNVTLFVDTFTSRSINIQIEKTFSSEYLIGEVRQSLYAVNVYGPESLIGNAEAYSSFELGNIQSDTVTVSGEIHLRDASTKTLLSNPYITMSHNTVDVTFVMYGEKTVPVTLALQGGVFSSDVAQFIVSTPFVTLRGPLSELAQIQQLSVFCDETEVDGKLNASVTAGELLAANVAGGSVSAVDPDEVLQYTVALPSVRYQTVRVPISGITVYGLPEDGSVHAVPNTALEVQIFGSAEAVAAYDSSLMTVRVNYRTLLHQSATGEYIGIAEITTGDSNVCVDGATYAVSIRLVYGTT